jgi:hypothetical protein
MSEGRKINRSLLAAEFVAGLAYAGLMALRASGFPPSVRAANPPLVYATCCTLYFALTVALFDWSYIAGARGHRVAGLVLLVFAVLMVPFLLLVSGAQY